jgi:hypothetical protein
MRILLGSGGFRTPERVALLCEQMRSFFGPVRRLLFVPYALNDHDAYVQKKLERGLDAGFELDGIHRHAEPRQAVRDADAAGRLDARRQAGATTATGARPLAAGCDHTLTCGATRKRFCEASRNELPKTVRLFA